MAKAARLNCETLLNHKFSARALQETLPTHRVTMAPTYRTAIVLLGVLLNLPVQAFSFAAVPTLAGKGRHQGFLQSDVITRIATPNRAGFGESSCFSQPSLHCCCCCCCSMYNLPHSTCHSYLVIDVCYACTPCTVNLSSITRSFLPAAAWSNAMPYLRLRWLYHELPTTSSSSTRC